MKISVTWHPPIALDGPAHDLCDEFLYDQLPTAPAIYIFARRFGPKLAAIYVGKAEVLRHRIRQQLNNNRLMRALESAPNGARVLIYGSFNGRRRQRLAALLETVERALINHFTEEGHELINKRGTRLPVDEIEFNGSRLTTTATGRTLRVPRPRVIVD
jgi:hypothetical protein